MALAHDVYKIWNLCHTQLSTTTTTHLPTFISNTAQVISIRILQRGEAFNQHLQIQYYTGSPILLVYNNNILSFS